MARSRLEARTSRILSQKRCCLSKLAWYIPHRKIFENMSDLPQQKRNRKEEKEKYVSKKKDCRYAQKRISYIPVRNALRFKCYACQDRQAVHAREDDGTASHPRTQYCSQSLPRCEAPTESADCDDMMAGRAHCWTDDWQGKQKYWAEILLQSYLTPQISRGSLSSLPSSHWAF